MKERGHSAATAAGIRASGIDGPRVPRQARSRRRVEAIVDAARAEVLDEGIEALTLTAVARRAGVPAASIYQYFRDLDDVIERLVETDLGGINEEVYRAVLELEAPTVDSVVRASMNAVWSTYAQRPELVEIWLRGAGHPTVERLRRGYNRQMALQVHDVIAGPRIFPGADPQLLSMMVVEMGERVFHLAFEDLDEGDEAVIEEGVRLLVTYLSSYAAPEVLDQINLSPLSPLSPPP